jgi:hypothetical protein
MVRKICLLLLPTVATALAFAQDNSAKQKIPVTTQWVLNGLKSPAQKGVVKRPTCVFGLAHRRQG